MTPEENQSLEEMAAKDTSENKSVPKRKTAPTPGSILDEGGAPDVEVKPAKKVTSDEAMPVDVPARVSRERISGVFSTQTIAKVGTGTTVRKTIQKAYWFAEEMSDKAEGVTVVMVQPLNSNNIPSGPKDQVPLADFLERSEERRVGNEC